MKRYQTLFCLFAGFMLCLPVSALPGPFSVPSPLPGTGQTQCYNNTVQIPCPAPGEDFYGQDGNYLINPPSYTKLDAGGNVLPDDAASWVMVRDNVTGLIWEMKQNKDGVEDYINPNDADNTCTWYDPDPATNSGAAGTESANDTQDFLAALRAKTGFSDWRLPSREELRSIVDYSIPDPGPTINALYFPNTISSVYWSSATQAFDTLFAWHIHFYSGGDNHYYMKSDSQYVRAVRGGQGGILNRWIINNDNTVTDTQTGLMWQRIAQDTMTWKNALSYCEGLTLGNYDDWRLPNIKELASLTDLSYDDPPIDTHYFPNTAASSAYWSSSTHINSPATAWCVDFWYYGCGGCGYYDFYKFDNHFVRAVRGGQNRLAGHLFILSPCQASIWNANGLMPITWDTASLGGDVKISVSYSGGTPDSYEIITKSTKNDGKYEWMTPDIISSNCMLKIESLSAPTKTTVQGLFTIGNFIAAVPPGLNLTEPSAPDQAGESRTFKIILNQKPLSNLTLSLVSSNPSEAAVSPASVTLTPDNWNTGVDVTVTPEWDGISDGDRQCAVLVSTVDGPIGFNVRLLSVINITVKDVDTQLTITSVYPSYGQTGQNIPAIIKGTGFMDGITQVFITDGVTETELSITVQNKSTISLTIPQRPSGDYTLKVSDMFLMRTHELQKAITFADPAAVIQHLRKKAIIVAGSGPYYDNFLWESTQRCAEAAYKALYTQGYGRDNIYYLNQSPYRDVTGDNQNDVDAAAALSNLQTTLTTWAAADCDELILYLVGPGGNGTFQFGSNQNPEYLTPQTLSGWLPALNGKTIVIYDAPYANSFMTQDLSGNNRVIITSASANEKVWFLNDGEISFSAFFWDTLFNKGELTASFNEAKDLIAGLQTPQIDADGDGTPDSRKRISERTGPIPIGRQRAAAVILPEITSALCNPAELTGGAATSTLQATISDPAQAGISRVWVRILSPKLALEDPGNPMMVVPTLKLLGPDGDNTYQNTYDPFSDKGTYTVFIQAVDRGGLQSFPQTRTVTQQAGAAPEPGDLNADGRIDLTDTLIALKIASGILVNGAYSKLDVSGDGKIGMEEAGYALRKSAGM
jgi:hypothetical protein